MGLAFLFPGQGSQQVGMGHELAEAFPEAREVFQEADDHLGLGLSDLMWNGPEEELTRTNNAQPALLVHSVAVHRVLAPHLGGARFAAGHSLGEFSAHVAAGTLTFQDAVAAVRRRGELMYETGVSRPGTMAAVLGLDDDVVESVCQGVSTGTCVPANFNAPGQVVISGDAAGVEAGMQRAREAGARKVIPLNVSGAFHSPLMQPAEDGLRAHLESIGFQVPKLRVYSNVTAKPVESGEVARDLLVHQLTAPVRWSTSIRHMVEAGAVEFVELGAGAVLCGLNRRNARDLPCRPVGTPAEVEAFINERSGR
ncbi:MAG: ACP S-malonyltransferase [Gemmatimonadales bacterium]|nr:MAG: ACP S-malonyltransferase [Gemmatimonadales bacterium]